jgi:hypothetical protein
MTDKTVIDRAVLRRYCDRLPACARFPENFFLTASGETYGNNLQNFRLDLDVGGGEVGSHFGGGPGGGPAVTGGGGDVADRD